MTSDFAEEFTRAARVALTELARLLRPVFEALHEVARRVLRWVTEVLPMLEAEPEPLPWQRLGRTPRRVDPPTGYGTAARGRPTYRPARAR